jgi:hypothetical protein
MNCALLGPGSSRKNAAFSATLSGRKKNAESAWWIFRANTTRFAHMRRSFRTKYGCCTKKTITCGSLPRNRMQLAALLGRVLRRIEKITGDYHMVVHTAPNTSSYKGELANYWTTIVDDYHWHIEILPIVESRSKSYSIKEVYFNPLEPEVAAERLRALDPGQ